MSKSRQPNFDRIARPYRWLEYLTLGPLLQQARTHFLPHLHGCRQALILGDGDGRFTAALLAHNPTLQAGAVDLSNSMLTLLRSNVADAGAEARIRTHCADIRNPDICSPDIRTFVPALQPDLIATHFVLDCLSQAEVEALVSRLGPGLPPGTLWLVSDFRIPSGVLHWPARLYVRLLYLAFRILTGLRTTRLPDHRTPLTQAGFHLVSQHHALFGLLASELWRRGNPQDHFAAPL